MLKTDDPEARLRARLYDYGAALTEAATVAAPPLEAWADPDTPAATRPRLRSWLAAAACLVLVVGAVTALTLSARPSDHEELVSRAGAAADSRWFRPGAIPAEAPDPNSGRGPVDWRVIDPATVEGWAALRDRLGDGVVATGAMTRGDSVLHLGFQVEGIELAFTFQRLAGPVTVPLTQEALDAGFRAGEGRESFAGETVDGTTLAQVVAANGRSTAMSASAEPTAAAAAIGDLVAITTEAQALVAKP